MKSWTIKPLTQDAALEWAKKPCWSMGEALFLLNGFAPEAVKTVEIMPDMPAYGGDADALYRAIISGNLAPVGPGQDGMKVYKPADIVRVAKAANIGMWRHWEGVLEAAAKDEILTMPPELWAFEIASEIASLNEWDDADPRKAQAEIQIMRAFEAKPECLPLRQNPSCLRWPTETPLPPRWREGLLMQADELREWAKTHNPEIAESRLLKRAPPGAKSEAPDVKQYDWCLWSNAASALACLQTIEGEEQARRILKRTGYYLDPLSGERFPFPAPEPSAEMLEKFPQLKDAPRDSNALLKLKMHRETTYRAMLEKLEAAGEIAFYDPGTMLRIAKGEAVDPIVMLKELGQQLKELAAKEADEKNAPPGTSQAPKGEAEPAKEWRIKARKIADEIAFERWNAGTREITSRNICDAVAKRLGKDQSTWGTRGERTGNNVRTEALKGWKFSPPDAVRVD